MYRSFFFMLMLCALISSYAMAEQVVLQMKSGEKITGDLVEQDDEMIVVRVDGINVRLAKERIATITKKLSDQEFYDQEIAKLKADDVDGHLALVNALVGRNSQIALLRAQQIIEKNVLPQVKKGSLAEVDAGILLTQIKRKLDSGVGASFAQAYDKLITEHLKGKETDSNAQFKVAEASFKLSQQMKGTDKSIAISKARQHAAEALKLNDKNVRAQALLSRLGAGKVAESDSSTPGVKVKPGGVMTEEQVNLIKLYELVDLSPESKPQVNIPRNVLNQFYEKYRENGTMAEFIAEGRQGKNRFLRLSGVDQLKIFFAVKAREFYPQATYRGDPPLFAKFKKEFYRTYIMNYFYRHFGDGSHGLALHKTRANDETVFYTNFYILANSKFNNASFIDRNNSQNSLILQWGLPREFAENPAPNDIRNWKPYFRDKDDPKYTALLEWIRNLRNPAPNYQGLDYQLAKP